MLGLKSGRHSRMTMFCIAFATLYIASCAYNAPDVTMDFLLGNGEMFNGKKLVVDGCLEPNEHGLVVSSCQPGLQAIPILYGDRLKSSQQSYLYGQALRSRIEMKQPLAVSLCGIYHQTDDGKDRWLEVTAFSLGHKSRFAGQECQN